jgi:putative Mg2+ transporter-C (MgtC) family protein
MNWTWWSGTTQTELELLGLALVFSAVIGTERQFHHKSAGMRTHVLVALGSATFTLVSAFGFSGVLGQTVNLDPSRIAAQIVSGVGFLGAGVIFMRRDVVRGLTTAASIWVSAAVGMACGAGMPALAAALTIGHVLVLTVLAPLTRRLPTKDRNRTVAVTYVDGQGILRDLLSAVGQMGSSFTLESAASDTKAEPPTATIRLSFTGGPPLRDLMVTMSEISGVQTVRTARDADDDD